MPARFSALTRSVRLVNLRNGRKFDTTQNSDDLAQRSSRDSKNARTLAVKSRDVVYDVVV